MPGITDGEQGLVIKWRYSINRQVHPTEYVALLDLTPDKNGTINYVIKSPGDRQFIIVSSYVKIYQRYFMLDYIQDITSLKTERSELWKRISLTLFTIDLCLFLLLHVIIKRAFEPLKQLKGQAKAMAEGDYSLKAEILYRDEVGQLAESFNQLADAVRAHIHTLSETAKLKELFAANLAHEIKTPLTSIVAYADYCAAKSSMKRDELQGILEFIKLEGQRIGALSDTILKWTSLNHHNYAQIKACRPDVIINQLLLTLNSAAIERNQKIIVENNTTVLFVDGVLLVSLLVNLCKNALNASDDNASIKLVLKNNWDGALCIQVIDEGRGIEADELKRIQEPFYMVDKARDRAKGGSGLGLPLCLAIVDAHHGSMIIDSEFLKGTCITVTIAQDKKCWQIYDMLQTVWWLRQIILLL